MAARTDCVGVKLQATDRDISWSLEFKGVRWDCGALRLQKWRVVGDGRTTREQIREYATTTFQVSPISHCAEGLISSKESLLPSSSDSPPPTVEEALVDDRGQSCSLSHAVVEEADTMTAQSAPTGASPSAASEFTNADVSGQEDMQLKKEEPDDDDEELTVKDAHSFEIFEPDDEEKREPASILDLKFDCDEGHPPDAKLHLIGFCNSDTSGRFMRTIDSWTIKPTEELNLKVYVRDTKGSWIKLWKPSKKYEGSVRDAFIITQFLEFALKSKDTSAKRLLDQLLDKIGYRRDEIKAVLSKYYPSVAEKLAHIVPQFSLKAAMINSVESLLKGKSEKGKLVATFKRPSSSDEINWENNPTGVHSSINKRRRVVESDPEIARDEKVQKERTQAMPTSNKRKRVVQSDTENDSASEDHVPLAQRQFQFSEKFQTNESLSGDEQVENALIRDEPEAECESKKQDQGSRTYADLPLRPACNIYGGRSRLNEGVDFQGEQGYQDVAEIYGGENDGLGEIGDDDDDDDDDEEVGDAAFCAICDDGGDLLLCDGPCMRSFHASKESAAKSESMCRSLGYTAEAVEEMGSWLCLNCLHGQHQCFICGQLGRSKGEGKEVFVCDVALCGRFYHPLCLAQWKEDGKYDGMTDPDAFSRSSKDGAEEFCCPAHKCRRCREGEQEGGSDNSMKLAKCRRCPKAYHKNCLPKKISFEGRGNMPIRAWEIGDEDDPMKRLVMYCLNHDIVERWSTPHRNHLVWPNVCSPMKNIGQKAGLNGMANLSPPGRQEQKLSKGTSSRQVSGHEADADMSYENYQKGLKGSSRQKVVQEDNTLERYPSAKADMNLSYSVTAGKDKGTFHTPKREAPVLTSALPPISKQADSPKSNDLHEKSVKVCPIDRKVLTSTEGRENRLLEIMRQASQNVTLETVKEKLVQPSCYGENRKKTFLQRGELESMLKAIRKASEKVKNGGSVEDAKRLCPKEQFIRMLKNEDLLKVHLAPILHGMRYTSFGRHFTCTDKLREIVNRIHPYIDSGDMVVDFCCGANDFSIILNEKLLSTGKTCHFMNFDIHPPKNDFCFTKGDWLTNQGNGFLEGRKLIMGLNPPFGVRAALANRFILHALKFRPKLLVLIVPPETMSYSNDYKNFNYDLVWEDRELLKGHAFYLPGSVDNNDRENMTQWNVTTPPLYLWSSREMLQKHRDIAVQCKHIDAPKADVLMVPNRRTPTPPPLAREVSRLKTSSDKWTNSGSTATQCDSGSSRLQPSSTSSSLADGLSQNSLEGPGPFISAGVHLASVQISSYRGQTLGQQASDQTAHHQFVHGSAVHNPVPISRPLHNKHPQPPLQHLISASRHPNVEEISLPGAPSSHSVSPFSSCQGSMVMPASEPHVNLVSPQLNQAIAIGNQAPWGQVEQLDAYPPPHHRQSHLDHVHLQNNSHAGQQHWPGSYNLPPSHAPHPVLSPFNHGFPQQFIPNWQAPQPFPGPPAFHPNPPHSGLPMLPPHLNRSQGVQFRGQPARSDGRSRANQQGLDKASGGWLDA